ncbi:RsmF rRNA methyltransferase first C-terminal domain-containing protein [Caldibacillus lycopersici]|uniref:RsmF rRNA methyltransferase first C-terminal domain-containing protein n=1 Tax=Perspicuibacillus lycopersici TaxID=1325689 RepID=A0AAE3LMI6_9BACI|nr:RsmF rRNA methyltransferase first C-terminal domain-containing protein [Perspicuibacillus lycopersici]MCU9613630.1 RsmF rRNA methyltransferase first C-terminal domain-containing protein [Perspicuibacillus lycopersici]
MTQLPLEFIEKMKHLLAEEADAFFDAFSEARVAGLRINPLKIKTEQWENISPFPLEKIPFVANGYYYNYTNTEPGKHPYHAAGVYYIQEPSAMFVASLLDAKPGEKILDLCAAPGGKSTQIGAAMENKGILISNEIHPKRAKVLSENIERFGISNAIVTNETPQRLAQHFNHYFDKILVDAPCSGEGMFRKDPEATKYWNEDHVLTCQRLQKEVLQEAYSMLKENGILVYSTCTFSPEENEQIVEWFLTEYPDMELLPIEKSAGIEDAIPEWTKSNITDIKKCARLWPHKMKGEGHFAAKLRKRSSLEPKKTKTKEMIINIRQNELKEFIAFQQTILQNPLFSNLALFGNVLHSLPDHCPDLKGLKILRAGLHLGEMKKNRFEPNHAFALSLHLNEVKQFLQLTTDKQYWLRYLKGETLKGTEKYKGWVLVTIDDFPLGWGKEVDAIVKNFYPKGLRILM